MPTTCAFLFFALKMNATTSTSTKTTVFGVVMVSLFLLIAYQYPSSVWADPREPVHQHGVHAETIMKTFTKLPDLEDLSPAADQAWDSLFPRNGGKVAIEHKDGEPDRWGISMFHQLHCLQMLRDAIQTLEIQSLNASSHEMPAQHHHGRRSSPIHHWQHCLSYLSQVMPALALPLPTSDPDS